MKKTIFLVVLVVVTLACALRVQAYRWFDEERVINNRFFLHCQLDSGDKLSPIVLPYNTYFRTEEIPDGCRIEIYKSPTGRWEDISWDLSQGSLVSVVTSDDVCPLLEKGEYIFKTISTDEEEVTFVFGPKKPKEELIPI